MTVQFSSLNITTVGDNPANAPAGAAIPVGFFRRWVLRALVALTLISLLAWAAGEVAGRRARTALRAQATTDAALHAAVLRSELEKHRSLPFVLADDRDVRDLLTRGSPSQVDALNRKLEALSRRTRAATIYILNAEGMTLAASNWRLPTSFVGSKYRFRPYFRDAWRSGTAEFFALGTVSGRPGLFLSRRVEGPAGPLGVVVVKVEFDSLETEWGHSESPAYVADATGVVVITSVPDWRFQTEHPVTSADLARMRQTLQFGRGPQGPLPLRPAGRAGEVVARLPGASPEAFMTATAPTSARGWTLHLLTPLAPTVPTAVVAARAVAVIVGGLAFAGIALLLRRREAETARLAAREAARLELERQVEARTAELRQANRRLSVEMEERRRAEATVHTMQDELVKASRLALLGQIAAGVAHEINQPVAAIQTYAETATVLLDRENAPAVRQNLGLIGGLTRRIGAITEELRAFSRKSAGAKEPVLLVDAIEGVLLLLAASMRALPVQLEREGDAAGVRVLAERMRLEQVLINLLQNAFEAVASRPDARVRLSVSADARHVRLRISDNGPGLSAAARAGLFTPFTTTKPNGLGLGLVISRDIVHEFGGRLVAEPDSGAGAAFTVILRRHA
jgi:two-component system C4-dicarboxylate transport sensor histidine kinase DctB